MGGGKEIVGEGGCVGLEWGGGVGSGFVVGMMGGGRWQWKPGERFVMKDGRDVMTMGG